jgi:hypothetical protein
VSKAWVTAVPDRASVETEVSTVAVVPGLGDGDGLGLGDGDGLGLGDGDGLGLGDGDGLGLGDGDGLGLGDALGGGPVGEPTAIK